MCLGNSKEAKVSRSELAREGRRNSREIAEATPHSTFVDCDKDSFLFLGEAGSQWRVLTIRVKK